MHCLAGDCGPAVPPGCRRCVCAQRTNGAGQAAEVGCPSLRQYAEPIMGTRKLGSNWEFSGNFLCLGHDHPHVVLG